MQQLQPLRPQFCIQAGHARDIAPRSGEAGDKSSRTGSVRTWNRIGIVEVAAFAASAAGVIGGTWTAAGH